jgi:hypothetical protein
MGESFGNKFTLVEVTSHDRVSGESSKQLWVAAAKPSQALTLVLMAVPIGWTAEIVGDCLTPQQLATLENLDLKPGEVRKLPHGSDCGSAISAAR